MNNDSKLPMQERQIFLLVVESFIYSKKNWRKDWITDTRVVGISTDFRRIARDAHTAIEGRVFVFLGDVAEFLDGRVIPIDWPSQSKNFKEVYRCTHGYDRALFRHLYFGITEQYPYKDTVVVHEGFRHFLIEYFI